MSSKKELYDEVKKSFHSDAAGFSVIAESDQIEKILNDFEDYELFLVERNKRYNSKKIIKKLSKGSNVIDGSKHDSELKKIFHYSHIAACCELFSGWQLPLQSLSKEVIGALVVRALSKYEKSSAAELNNLYTRVHKADTVRTIQILRLMGLLSTKSSKLRQLSFASGNAQREIDGVHMTPLIQKQITVFDNNSVIKFSNKVMHPEHMVLIDNAPEFNDLYKSFNNDFSSWILALNEDAEVALEKIKKLINEKQLKPLNFIAGIRIDHEIIPDIPGFFNQICPLLDSLSDFVISVGAGHSVEEFEGRINLMSAMFIYLEGKGLEPVRIILHGSGSFEEQRNSPLFGAGPTSTYEILYCKIKKKKLI